MTYKKIVHTITLSIYIFWFSFYYFGCIEKKYNLIVMAGWKGATKFYIYNQTERYKKKKKRNQTRSYIKKSELNLYVNIFFWYDLNFGRADVIYFYFPFIHKKQSIVYFKIYYWYIYIFIYIVLFIMSWRMGEFLYFIEK